MRKIYHLSFSSRQCITSKSYRFQFHSRPSSDCSVRVGSKTNVIHTIEKHHQEDKSARINESLALLHVPEAVFWNDKYFRLHIFLRCKMRVTG